MGADLDGFGDPMDTPPRLKTGTTVCVVDSCYEMIERPMVMCMAHWGLVPSSQQHAVADSLDDPNGHVLEVRRAAMTVRLLGRRGPSA